ncbi:MAG: hypothetical protein CSMARM5_0068 [Candidatus Parvarchaeum acidophilus ARMAN-5_'5-way FS']|jgi:hypothetical protein|uniref:Uncharacterized protein n=2 Tax=Parvarchaeum acidophilus TaxID=662761 RepID=D6GW71_PARA5|nr:MAG: hypothetical protein BJBARM5_0746 [Candidatus Parvarchaeum acidophilus ARMAN-5]EGD71871.1 MAG: hypothetical protein CSMARM5_0068 [Candidatus Parvarchaeum acidophilus ARMAN-5_'5-way FS']
MQKRSCQFCNFPIEKEWSFCPQCGRPLKSQGINVSGVNIDVTKMVQEILPQVLNGALNGSIYADYTEKRRKETPKRDFSAKEIIEPEDLVSKHGNTVIHAISLPGVKNRSDIDISHMQNSIEVRAKNRDRVYLKILKRDSKQSVISEEFANENLVLVLRKTN